MDIKFENIPRVALHTFHLIYLAQDTCTFIMDVKFENIPSFVLSFVFSMIENLIIFQVLSSTLFYWYTYLRTIIHICCVRHNTSNFFMDLKFEIIPSFVFHTFLLIYLSQDSNTYLNCTPRFISRETCTCTIIALVSLNMYQSQKNVFPSVE